MSNVKVIHLIDGLIKQNSLIEILLYKNELIFS